MRKNELLAWLCALPAADRDRCFEAYLGISAPRASSAPPGGELIGYHASGVAAIVRALVEVPVLSGDIVVDLGAGLGKVVLLTHLLTGAIARGIELQPELVARARAAASRLQVGERVELTLGDAREAELSPGSVFYLYAPFSGAALTRVLARLKCLAAERAIVVCALGVDLREAAGWLVPRPSDAFWLTLYDSVVSGAAPRLAGHSTLPRSLTDIVTLERDATSRDGAKHTARSR